MSKQFLLGAGWSFVNQHQHKLKAANGMIIRENILEEQRTEVNWEVVGRITEHNIQSKS